MQRELDLLASKMGQLVQVTYDLRQENRALRQYVAQLEANQGLLQQRMNEAADRVESLMASLPEPEPSAEQANEPDDTPDDDGTH